MKYRIMLAALLAVAALLTACGGGTVTTGSTSPTPPATSAAASTRQVQVTLTDSKVTSSRTTFMANVPYDFTVTNKGTVPHNFIIQTRIKGPAVTPQPKQGIRY